MPFHFPTIFREAIKDSSAIWLVDWKHVKEPQPGTCFSFPTPELAKYSSSSSPYYSRKRHRSSWPLEGQGWGQDRIHNTGSPGEERTSHVEGVCPHPHPLSPAPLRGFPGLLWRQEEREAALTPISSPLLPSCPLSRPCSPRWKERTRNLETRPLEGEHGCFSLKLSLPESRFQIATGTGATRKSQV